MKDTELLTKDSTAIHHARYYSIFFYEEYLGASPTVINLAEVLAENADKITIYTLKYQNSVPLGKLNDRIEVIYLTKWRSLYKFLDKPLLRSLSSFLEFLQYGTQTIFKLATAKGEGTQINIGVDVFGLTVAWIVSLIFKQKYLFLSLELRSPRQMFGVFLGFMDRFVQKAYLNNQAVLIQDSDRLNTLSKNYSFEQPHYFYLPNAPLGKNLDKQLEIENFPNYFRKSLLIDTSEYPIIVLHAGMISDAVMLKELATAFVGISNGSAFVVHCGVVNAGLKSIAETFIPDLQRINSHNLFLSLNPLPYDQINRVYSSATIGLVFYQQVDSNLNPEADNLAQIASASGKFTHFLGCAKPVLVSNLPSLVHILDEYPCGIVIEDPTSSIEVEQAISKIMSDYDTYSFHARECFRNMFDFSEKAKPILKFIDLIVSD